MITGKCVIIMITCTAEGTFTDRKDFTQMTYGSVIKGLCHAADRYLYKADKLDPDLLLGGGK